MIESNVYNICQLFGSGRKVAKLVGVSGPAVSKWDRTTGEIPAKHHETLKDAARAEAEARVAEGLMSKEEAEQFVLQVLGCLPPGVCHACGRSF